MPKNMGSLLIWGFLGLFAIVAANAASDGRKGDHIFPKITLENDQRLQDIDQSVAQR